MAIAKEHLAIIMRTTRVVQPQHGLSKAETNEQNKGCLFQEFIQGSRSFSILEFCHVQHMGFQVIEERGRETESHMGAFYGPVQKMVPTTSFDQNSVTWLLLTLRSPGKEHSSCALEGGENEFWNS